MRVRHQKLVVLLLAGLGLAVILFGKPFLLLHLGIRTDVTVTGDKPTRHTALNLVDSLVTSRIGLSRRTFPTLVISSTPSHGNNDSNLTNQEDSQFENKTVIPTSVPTPSLEDRFYKLRSTKLNSLKYKLISSQSDLCQFWKYVTSSPRVLILVLSNPSNKAERTAIRNTWASNQSPYDTPSVKVLFIVGDNEDHVLREELRAEGEEYRDLLQADFPDSYQSITTKVLIALDWSVRFCSDADYFFKTDDDIFVNVPSLVRTVGQFDKTNTLFGVDIGFAPVKRKGKWQLSVEQFPFEKFPLYVSGCGYGMTVDAAEKLVKTSEYVPQIPLEDVYVTGILTRIANVSVQTSHAFPTWMSQTPNDACLVLTGRMVALHGVKVKRMYDTWKQARGGDRCVLQ